MRDNEAVKGTFYRRLNLLVMVEGGFSAALGLLVLVGWHTENVTLIQVLPAFVPMQYNTALGFLIGGLGLLATVYVRPRLIAACGATIGAVGLLTLIEYILGIDLGIDEFLMEHYITVETSHPGRMAPNTALCFVLTGSALLLASWLGWFRERAVILGLLSSIIVALSLTAFFGYLSGVETGYGWGRLTRMAVHTAAGFVVLGTGVFALAWRESRGFGITETAVHTREKPDIRFLILSIFLAGMVFLVDLSLPLGVAGAVPYIAVVLVSLWLPGRMYTISLAVLCTTLSLLGFIWSPAGGELWKIAVNRFLAVFAIWVTAVLSLQRKRGEMELEARVKERTEALQQLEVANKELEAFSYSVSHDLRAPLRAIDGFSTALVEDHSDKLDGEGKRILDIIRNNALKMGQLIDDLLTFSRLGRQRIEYSYINMTELAREVLEELQPIERERPGQVDVGALPPTRGDSVMIHQVFVNLLSNAIKFTRPRDTAEIEVGARIEGNGNVYYVRDNGVGFDMAYVDKLFGVFQRLHSSEEFEGTGVGLSLVHRIIHRHSGRVWAEGQVNEGATFYFTLPRVEGKGWI